MGDKDQTGREFKAVRGPVWGVTIGIILFPANGDISIEIPTYPSQQCTLMHEAGDHHYPIGLN